MDRRLFWWFCVLTALRSARAEDPTKPKPKPKINIKDYNLNCEGGTFLSEPMLLMEDVYETYTCLQENAQHCQEDENCMKITVKVLSSENLIEVAMGPLIGVLMGNIAATALIGWAVYSICAQPRVRSSYQGSKASDRVNLINNHPAGDTYQPLNTRSDEYSTLHGPRKQKNPKHPI